MRNHTVIPTDFSILGNIAIEDINTVEESGMAGIEGWEITSLITTHFSMLEATCADHDYDVFKAQEEDDTISVRHLIKSLKAALYVVEQQAHYPVVEKGVLFTSKDKFLRELRENAMEDKKALIRAKESYGQSWQQRGGVGAFMMLARKYDRMFNQLQGTDLIKHLSKHLRNPDGILDDVVDLRRYLLLVETYIVQAEMEAAAPNSGYTNQG